MHSLKRYHFHKIALSPDELAFGVNNLLQLEISGKTICIAQVNGLLKACSAKCPHASGALAEGYLDPLGNIVCPVHRYKFSLENGRNISGEGYHLKTFPIEIREDGVFVGIEESGFLTRLFTSPEK